MVMDSERVYGYAKLAKYASATKDVTQFNFEMF